MSDVLSSDILEKQFGPTEVEVLYQDAATRIIATRVTSSGQILELSRVTFIRPGIEKFPATHLSVTAGASMGKAFRADGVEFVRQEHAAYSYGLPTNFQRCFDSQEPATVVIVSILAGPGKTPYAEILETYSPAVRWPRLDGKPTAEQLAAIQLLDGFLAGQSFIATGAAPR